MTVSSFGFRALAPCECFPYEYGTEACFLREDYEVGRAFPACAEPPRPRRLPLGTPIGCEQADVIFSRRDEEWL